MGRWDEIVGAEIAGARRRRRRFEDGVLAVRADSTAWATQVRLLTPTLLRRLAEELGEGVVRAGHGRAARPARRWRKGHATGARPGPARHLRLSGARERPDPRSGIGSHPPAGSPG